MLPSFVIIFVLLNIPLFEILIAQVDRIDEPFNRLIFVGFVFLRLLPPEYFSNLRILELPLFIHIIIDGLCEGHHEEPGHLIMKLIVFRKHFNLACVFVQIIHSLHALLLLVKGEQVIAPTVSQNSYIMRTGLW
jgi:hypothetical protein